MKQLKQLHQRLADWLRERRIAHLGRAMTAAYTAGNLTEARRQQAMFLTELRARSTAQCERMTQHWTRKVAR